MPFWGDPGHFREAVESVIAQDDSAWRLLVVDDVYPDTAPGEWVSSLGDSRISYVRNEANLGPSRNYDKAVGLVSGEFVVIMGCDDRMRPGYVRQVKQLIATHPDADIIQPGVQVINEHGEHSAPLPDRIKRALAPKTRGTLRLSGERAAVSLLHGNWTYFPSLVWRRTRIAGGFRPDLNVVQDLAKILEIIFDGGSLVVDDEAVFEYRRHSASVSSRTAVDGSKYGQELRLFREIAIESDARGWRKAARAARLHWTSRLSALASVPSAIKAKHTQGRRALLRHAFGRTGRPTG